MRMKYTAIAALLLAATSAQAQLGGLNLNGAMNSAGSATGSASGISAAGTGAASGSGNMAVALPPPPSISSAGDFGLTGALAGGVSLPALSGMLNSTLLLESASQASVVNGILGQTAGQVAGNVSSSLQGSGTLSSIGGAQGEAAAVGDVTAQAQGSMQGTAQTAGDVRGDAEARAQAATQKAVDTVNAVSVKGSSNAQVGASGSAQVGNTSVGGKAEAQHTASADITPYSANFASSAQGNGGFVIQH